MPTISTPQRGSASSALPPWILLFWLALVCPRRGRPCARCRPQLFVSIAVQVAKILGAGRVVAAGRNADRLERALQLGADAVVELDGDGLGERLAAVSKARR